MQPAGAGRATPLLLNPGDSARADQRPPPGDERPAWLARRTASAAHNPAMQRILLAATRRPTQGITVVELAVVMAIVAILAAVAWPAYMDSVRKGRRSDAMAALAQAMQAQERFRSNATQYAAALTALNLPSGSPKGYYALVVDAADASGYRLTATVVSGQPQAQDTLCQVFIAEMNGGQVAYRSQSSSGANPAPDPCWVQ
jgi:type IV pilus assembly protein PilE